MQENEKSKTADYTEEYPKFTPEMKDAYTILVPDMRRIISTSYAISWASAAIAWRC